MPRAAALFAPCLLPLEKTAVVSEPCSRKRLPVRRRCCEDCRHSAEAACTSSNQVPQCCDRNDSTRSSSSRRPQQWPSIRRASLRRKLSNFTLKVGHSFECRYQRKPEAEIKRLEELMKEAKAAGEPRSLELSAEQALERIAQMDSSFCTLDVEEIMSLDKELREDLQALWEMKRPRGHISLGLVVHWSVWERLGLPRSLRVRSLDPPPVITLHKPTVEELKGYVMRNQPVIIKGALDEEGFPPLADFRHFAYLNERCGNRPIKVKADSFVDEKGRQLYVSDPSAEMPFSEFLLRVEQAECYAASPSCYMGKTKLLEFLPELKEDLEDSPNGPMQLYGECFGSNQKGAHIYFGCGMNTTAIHCDPSENLLVVVSGTKTFEIYPPTDADCLYVIKQPSYLNSPLPPFVRPDAMPAKMAEQYPLYRHARPQRVELTAGDMFYLPIFWWHAVTGSLGRNMILNWWSEMHPDKLQIGPGRFDDISAKSIVEALQEQLK